ncbi:timeless-domain-containing protein [Thelephora ganbajun]|uniref:Timeless-domain-containing protein n=1 Tax=Thelephora ganbajun TaxID=370292 RepID=A0ACB6Z4C6_THEGA|nr:timeless-domain-containing protein [Thelephora ganbajun]
MPDGDAISISSGSDGEEQLDRRAILEPAIQSVVDALGGFEDGIYRMGDECYSCLKDLKKFWRKDDTDDERTVARIFSDCRVLSNDLIPVLTETAGKGHVEDKRAIACVDLITAVTWPIDLAEELKEMDEELDKGSDYTQLLSSHLRYKAAMLQPGILKALFSIILPCLAKSPKERKERDIQIITVVLFLVRNLAFIKDLPSNTNLSSDQAEFSSLQSRLIKALSEDFILEFLLTIASNASTDPLFNRWNVIALEIFYLIFRGVRPASLVIEAEKQASSNLNRLLSVEGQRKLEWARNATSRHSRFGTTITVTKNAKPHKPTSEPSDTKDEALPPRPYVLHRQKAITAETGEMFDVEKKQRTKKGKKIDALAREDTLSLDSRKILQGLAKNFVKSCFSPFLSSLLKDIRSERPKITEKDNLRLLFITKWFLEFFLQAHAKEKTLKQENIWDFGFVAEVTDRGWITWVLRRMREALDAKPKMWTEFQAGIECLTQLLLLIERMSTEDLADVALTDVAEVLQNQLIYNGEVLEIALESLKAYKDGTQSLVYLDSSVHLAYALLRMLEKWTKVGGGREMYVRKKARRKKKAKGPTEEEGIPDVEEEEAGENEEEEVKDMRLTFEGFELRFANSEVTKTLLAYLGRYKEFPSPEHMKRVVGLLHRQAVRAKAEGLFFNVSTLALFKSIMDHKQYLPREQPYKDLVNLIQFLLRQFFKAVDDDPFIIVHALYPKNRGHWKQFSSWKPEEKFIEREKKVAAEVQVTQGYTWTEEMGIVIACLVEDEKAHLIDWVKEILSGVISQRKHIIEETDKVVSDDDDDDEGAESEAKLEPWRNPSGEAIAKFTDFPIPYKDEAQADATTNDPHLKLLFRLLKFEVQEEQDSLDETQWIVPAKVMPFDMQSQLNVIDQFLKYPIDLQGKKASELLKKKPRKRRPRRVELDENGEPPAKKERKKKEAQQYKSATMIEDSDADEDEWAAFFEREKKLAERTALAATASGTSGTMRATGTKKRRRTEGKKRRRKRGSDVTSGSETEKSGSELDREPPSTMQSPQQGSEPSPPREPPEEPARPRPRPRKRLRASSPPQSSSPPFEPTPLPDLEDR